MTAAADEFYLQDSRSYCGNDMFWWCPEGAGYTTDLRKAAVYTREEAQRKHDFRPTDIPWPKAYIDARTRPAVDVQYTNRTEALTAAGITLRKEKPYREPPPRCEGCRRFMSKHDFWLRPCSHCGMDNRP